MLQHEWTLKMLCYVKETSHKTSRIIWLHSYKMSRIGKSIETESKFMVSGSLGKEGHGVSTNGQEVTSGEDH